MAARNRGRAHQPVGDDAPPDGPSVGVPPVEDGLSEVSTPGIEAAVAMVKTAAPRKRRRGASNVPLPAPDLDRALSGVDLPSYAADWPAQRPSTRRTADLKPWDRNPRHHDANQIAAIARSMEEFGFTFPILHDEEGRILAGHGRWEAAKLAGFDVVPTIEARGWTEAQKRAYVIADNQIALDATWDMASLKAELTEIKADGYDLGLTGLSFAKIGEVLDLQAPVVDHAEAWNGMPEFAQGDKSAFKSIVMHFRNQDDVDAFERLIKQKVNPKTRYLWFPEITIETASDKAYVNEP